MSKNMNKSKNMNEPPDVNCADAHDLFSAHDDGTLADRQRKSLEAHLVRCEGCRDALADHSRAMTALRGTVPARTSQAEVDRILSAIDQVATEPEVAMEPEAVAGATAPRRDEPEDEVLVYRRALLSTAPLHPPSRARRVVVLAMVSWMGAAAAVLLVWSFGWTSPFGATKSGADLVVDTDTDTGTGTASASASASGSASDSDSASDTASEPATASPTPTRPATPAAPVRPVLHVDTEPLARLGQLVWGDVRRGASSALATLREQAQRMQLALPAAPVAVQEATPVRLATAEPEADLVPLVARPEPLPEPRLAAPPAPRPEPRFEPRFESRPAGGMAVVLRNGSALELRVSGSVREMVPTLLNLLERDDEDLVALASARLEALRGKVHALPRVGAAVERELAAAGSTGSWWSGLFREEPVAEPEPTLSESWMRWWSVAEPLLPVDPSEGAA